MTQPGILFQHFYYPTPELPAERSWWKQATAQLAELAALGVWGIWHPAPIKGGGGKNSMGYDPYDYYDLGSKDQRGSVATHFGTRDEYLTYVAAAHTHGLSVIADVVLNHNSGADQAQLSPVQERLGWDDIPDDSKVPRDHLPLGYDPKRDNLRAWSGFNPKGRDGLRGTGRFPRDARHFHPTALHPDHKEPYHHPYFGSDFCFEAENGYVAKSFLAWSEWFVKQSGVDGYRLDAVKLMEPEFLRDFAAATRPGSYLVGELWDTNPKLLADFQSRTERRMKLFDFGLYYALRDMMTNPNFDMRELLTRRFADRERAVMFVSNHDVDRDSPIPRDKRGLPYAVMMAMAGQPSIFHLDYLGPDTRPYSLQHTLRNLTSLYNALCWGKESVLLATKDVLALERESGLIAVFVRPGGPREIVVPTRWKKRQMAPVGNDFDGSILLPGPTTDAQGNLHLSLSDTAPYGIWEFYAPLERTRERKRRRTPLPTTQVFEFANDLDTGRLGEGQQIISITAKAGSELVARLIGTYGEGNVLVELRDSQNRGIAAATAQRGRAVVLRARIPANGTYRFLITAPGNPTTGELAITYFGATSP